MAHVAPHDGMAVLQPAGILAHRAPEWASLRVDGRTLALRLAVHQPPERRVCVQPNSVEARPAHRRVREAVRRLVRFGVIAPVETYGPFDAPSVYNPCMRSGARGVARCVPWGFAVLRYTRKGLAGPESWPGQKKRGQNRGARCFDTSLGQVRDE